MKRLIISLLLLLIMLLSGIIFYFKFINKQALRVVSPTPEEIEKIASKIEHQRLQKYTKDAFEYIKVNNFDDEHAILIDFSLHSGKKRFFVWNFKTHSIEFSSLVAHGYGNENYQSTASDIIFSNVEGSYASSLGKYRIGIRAPSKWGINIHYKLHGLDSSNSNAYKRYIVLHSYQLIPNSELFPFHLPLGFSQGCPVIDNVSMQKIDQLMQTKTKPVLLWIYQ